MYEQRCRPEPERKLRSRRDRNWALPFVIHGESVFRVAHARKQHVDAAETLDVPVVLDTMSAQANADAKVLFYALAFACRGVAVLILRRVSAGNGLEAWGQLHKRFSVGTSSTALSTLQVSLSFGFGAAWSSWRRKFGSSSC
jgi:hypothetical protein